MTLSGFCFYNFINIKSTNSSLCDRKTLREGQTLTLRRADFNTYQMYIEFALFNGVMPLVYSP